MKFPTLELVAFLRLRILIITNLFFPDRGGGASVFSDLCFGLVEHGWQVTVFTTHPYYPEWHRRCEGSPWRIQRELIRGVEVLRHGLYVPTSPSKLIPRVLYELSFGASLLRSTLRGGRFDAVMVYCPMLGAVLFAAVRKLLRGEPLWLNVQDIPADAAAASGISRSGLFDRVANGIQRWLFNRADVWSTISPVMQTRVATMRARDQPLHLCPNWLNGSLAEHIEELPSKLGRAPASPVRLLYAGNIGKKQGLLEFCERLARTSLAFRFQIHGNGGEAEPIRRWVADQGDVRFVFGEFLDEASFTQALHVSDIFVITEKPGSGASFIPSKLIPGIASGTPVLAVCDRTGPLGSELTAAGLGVIVEWAAFDQIEEQFRVLTGNATQFASYQQRCLDHAQTYSRAVGIDRFDRLLAELPRRCRTST